MGWTKRQFISAAFEEIGLAEHVFDLSPDQIKSALFRLDTCVSRLKVRIPWTYSTGPTALNIDSGCPQYAVEAVMLSLAVAIAPSYGKSVSSLTLLNLEKAMDIVETWSSDLPPIKRMPAMLAGSGNGSSRFLPQSTDPLISGDSIMEFE